jgi:CelD/BcsL family acetyltransferase involved in cellulose biosynthesis
MSELARTESNPAILSTQILDAEEAYPLWELFSSADPFGVAQMLPWVRCWRECVNSDLFVATVTCGDTVILMLPLEIVWEHGITVARYIGGSHANANFPLLKPDALHQLTPEIVQSLFAAIKSARPQLDALVLTRQLRDFAGIANPLLCFGSSESPNLSLSFNLGPDFEVLAKERGWSRKQKKMRNQARRLEDRGGWACVKSDSADAALRLMDTFFILKAARFKEFGQRNTFENENVKAFFRTLFKDASDSPEPQFMLDALSVNGKVLAVSGSVFKHDTVVVEFGAVDGTETALSPGDFLYHQMIKRACFDGYAHFSFGVGDEPYKRSWCDIETHHRDSTHAFTLKGRVYLAVFRISVAAKRAIKRNAFLFGLVKKWRERNAGTASTALDAD